MRVAGATIVVTGGIGFLGHHVSEELERNGAKVFALGIEHYDLRRRGEADRMLADTRPDAVVHLAALVGGIGANQAAPGQFFYENAVMGIELIDACRVAEVAKVVITGTACSYPKHARVPFQEESFWDGYPDEANAPDGLAKKMLLVQAQAYRAQYGMNVVYLVPVNLYGPRDNFDLESSHVIAAMIRKFVAARDRGEDSVTLWGDGGPTREFLHVRDAARAFRLALERYDGAEPVNLGSGKEVAIRDLAALIARATQYHGEILWDATRPNGQPRRCMSTRRAREWLGFEADVTLEEGLAEVVGWYERQQTSQRNT
jgi:GDP-L-fucose synthase